MLQSPVLSWWLIHRMMINTFSVLFEVSKQQTVSDYKLTKCINKAGTCVYTWYISITITSFWSTWSIDHQYSCTNNAVTKWSLNMCHPVSTWSLSGVTLYIEVSKQRWIMNCIRPGVNTVSLGCGASTEHWVLWLNNRTSAPQLSSVTLYCTGCWPLYTLYTVQCVKCVQCPAPQQMITTLGAGDRDGIMVVVVST